MKEVPLTQTNSYIRDPQKLRDACIDHVIASSAIEGVKIGRELFNRPEGSFICLDCNKLLAKPNKQGVTAGEIKCPRCGLLNEK